jgi:hypothetical protein
MASGTQPDLDEIDQVIRIIRSPIIKSAGEPIIRAQGGSVLRFSRTFDDAFHSGPYDHGFTSLVKRRVRPSPSAR